MTRSSGHGKQITLPGIFSFSHYAMHRLCFISKRSDLERISKYWKIGNFLKKKRDFEKGMPSHVYNIGINQNASKEA